MAQYQSHIPKTFNYIDTYLAEFYQIKQVFLKFCISKRVTELVLDSVKQLQEKQRQAVTFSQHITAAKQCRIKVENQNEVLDLQESIIHQESHFNFIKMHLL